MEQQNIADQLIEAKRFVDLYILARYMYRVGSPIVGDGFYDRLEQQFKKIDNPKLNQFIQQSYDDDPIPLALLSEFGIKPVYSVVQEGRRDLYEYLNEDKSYSIKSVTSYEDAFTYFSMLKEEKLDFVASLKMDGVNTKMLYKDSQFALSLSRGRGDANSFDYTDNSAKIMPQTIEGSPSLMKVTGESYVIEEGLEYLRKKYGKPDGYVSGKSSAISMLRVSHDLEDYRFLRTRVFSAEGLGKTLHDTFETLVEKGVDVVPYKLFSWEDIPEDFETFKGWLKSNIFDYLHVEGAGMPSDGVVIEVDDLSWVGTEHNQYVSRQLALKFEYWDYGFYEGIVKDIHIEQRRVKCSVRIEIEPIRTADGNKATIINSFNPQIIVDNDLYEGKHVFFERNSNASNVLLYGDRCKELVGE